jgi:antitoxin component YwqK of YwqJK toxin-antitoxin module
LRGIVTLMKKLYFKKIIQTYSFFCLFYFCSLFFFVASIWAQNLLSSNPSLEIKPRKIKITGQPYSFALIPDTQFYVYERQQDGFPLAEIFSSQTRWITEHLVQKNIIFAMHLGDVTEQSSVESEWIRGKTSMKLLDNSLPYIMVPGNHDYFYNKGFMTKQAVKFNQYFPLKLFKRMQTFGGEFESNKSDNTYHYLNVGKTNYLIMGLEFAPRDEVLEWANQLIGKHPNHVTMVIIHGHIWKHELMNDSHTWASLPFADYNGEPPGSFNNGVQVWNKLLKKHSNLKFLFCGHARSNDRILGQGIKGNQVFQLLSNYQHFESGGNGYLRLLTFSPNGQFVSVSTYSPYLGKFLNDSDNRFGIDIKNGAFIPEGIEFEISRSKEIKTETKKEYYKNKKIKTEWNYVDGYLQDVSKEYDIKGNLKRHLNFQKGHLSGISKTYYENGEIEQILPFKNGKLVGLAKHFFKNGKLKEEIPYESNKKEGLVKRYYANGNLREQETVQNGKRNGKSFRYYKSGALMLEKTYRENLLDGLYSEFYQSKVIKRTAFYKNGKLSGLRRDYADSGTLTAVMDFDNGVKVLNISFYPEGGFHELNFFRNNFIHGTMYEFDQKGNLIKQVDYKNGNVSGAFRRYYEIGMPRILAQYEKDELNGNWIQYFQNGQVKWIQHYKRGKEDGESLAFYLEGGLKKIVLKQNNQLEETQYTFYPNGKLKGLVELFKGKPEGVGLEYYSNGEIRKESYFKDGMLNGKSKVFFDNGKIKLQVNFKNGKRNGKSLIYFKDGNLQAEANFKNGNVDGNSFSFFKNGQIKFFSSFKDGKKHGVWKEYSIEGTLSKTFVFENDSLMKNKINN